LDRREKMRKFAVIGLGRFGGALARNLAQRGAEVIAIDKDSKLIDEIKESHVVRFFFPQELRHYLEENFFKLIEISEFMKLNKPPTEKVWNAIAISKATKVNLGG